MLRFFKKKTKPKTKDNYLNSVASLLIHAAKIDESYTDNEKEIIKKTLIELGVNASKVDELVDTATINEENSNHILDFTKEIKSTSENNKIKIVESLWKIIYSNKNSDMYESNLMRRLAGLLYIDNKLMGDIKEKVKREFLK